MYDFIAHCCEALRAIAILAVVYMAAQAIGNGIHVAGEAQRWTAVYGDLSWVGKENLLERR